MEGSEKMHESHTHEHDKEKSTGEEKSSEKGVTQALQLANLVSYQEGAVVSRTLINKKTGTVTLFAFDEGQALSTHTTPFDALVYIIDGQAKIVISGKAFRLKRGEVITMPANEPHSLKAVEKFKMLLIMIRS